jgi:hypothetical protein
MKSFALSSFMLLTSTTLSTGWQQLGPPIPEVGATVELSDSGARMAIGAPAEDGAVFLYEMDQISKTWNLLANIQGTGGEGMGDFISLSPDGNFLAVRRYHVTPSVVQVYQTNGNVMEQIGSDVRACDEDGQSVTLGQASVVPRQGGKYFLLASCESYDNDRGKVQAFQLNDDGMVSGQSVWETFLEPLEGRASGDRFGSAVSFAEAPSPLFAASRVFRVSVSAPNYDDNTGLVQLFSADIDHGWSQFGDDLVGEQPGEMFGASIAMSSTEDPYVVIGSPNRSFAQGAVRLVHWRSLTFGGPFSWNNVGNRLDGAALNHRSLGKSVAISRDGGRIAVSSMEIYEGGRSYVSVLDRTTYDDLFIASIEPWGGHVALNSQGSVVAVATACMNCQVASPSDGVRVLFDDSDFCALPTEAADGTQAYLDMFLMRAVCRSGTLLLADETLCSQSVVFMNGEFIPCKWIPALVLENEDSYVAPTSAPQVHQTSDPTHMPSAVPSTIPAHHVPSHGDTLTSVPPSYRESQTTSPRPSVGPSGTPSVEDSTSGPSDSSNLDSPSHVSSFPPSQSQEVYTPSPTRNPSISPSGSSRSASSSDDDDDMATPDSSGFGDEVQARACHCDALGRCISEPLVEGSTLNVCVDVGSPDFIVNIVDCHLHQGKTTVPVIEDTQPLVSDAFNDCIEGLCVIHTQVESMFFNDDGDFLVVTGTIGVVDTRKRNLRQSRRHLSTDSLQYSTVVFLKNVITNESTVTEGKPDGKSKSRGLSSLLLWLLLSFLVFVLVVIVCWYIRRQRLAKAASCPGCLA